MPFALLLAVALQSTEPVDLPALDAAIERCERSAVLPVFAAEARRRSAAVTAFYQEQARIAAERLDTANRRRALRESAASQTPSSEAGGVSDQELGLRQLALDDRQRALDDQRRLETMRQEAIDLKRNYFLAKCPAGRKSD
ncbi:hypothetical protein MZO42_19805 [Sphingomonas psychrotolerans]|uniref:Uncharacterized protein n=1 Tax=Sphingomonas psychrotolerans TaxID=1327635 RepID=A0ABU3NBU3_9SPHN|nr:hypothetical protein [Sphingomonas psychrotolerans]MDT8760951.1 hypothetical protein [Sphingomonas psychrotolerans]